MTKTGKDVVGGYVVPHHGMACDLPDPLALGGEQWTVTLFGILLLENHEMTAIKIYFLPSGNIQAPGIVVNQIFSFIPWWDDSSTI